MANEIYQAIRKKTNSFSYVKMFCKTTSFLTGFLKQYNVAILSSQGNYVMIHRFQRMIQKKEKKSTMIFLKY